MDAQLYETYLNEVKEYAKIQNDMCLHLEPIFLETVDLKPKLILELGIRGGVSTYALERAARLCGAKMICVDRVDCSSVCSYAEFVISDDVEFAQVFGEYCQKRGIESAIDLLMIDTEHTLDQTLREWAAWSPWLASNFGLILHDTNTHIYPEMPEFVERLTGQKLLSEKRITKRVNGWHVNHSPDCFGLTILRRLDMEEIDLKSIKLGARNLKQGELIGGHSGMDVFRNNGQIIKHIYSVGSRDNINIEALHNEAKYLRLMKGSGFAPELLEEHDTYIMQTDVGDNKIMQDGEHWRRQCIRFMSELRKRNIRHEDLTFANIVIWHDSPIAIDWQGAQIMDEPPKSRAAKSDGFLFWRTASGVVPMQTKTADQNRIIRRWLAILYSLGADLSIKMPLKGKTLLDLGCFQGDFCAMATTEGMKAVGIDTAGFRSGEDCIAEANSFWRGMNCSFIKADIMNIKDFRYDVVLMFSTWVYILRDYGLEKAKSLLKSIISQAGIFFFETQLYGDGIGPAFLKTDDNVKAMLSEYGEVKAVMTIPVWNRPAKRTVWKVTKK